MTQIPRVDLASAPPTRRYQELLAAGGVHHQSCQDCGSPVFPPRVLCPACGSTRLDWCESGGTGVVYAATTIYSRNSPPYTVALVDLDEGFRVMATIGDADPDRSHIGARVSVVVAELDGQPALLASLGQTSASG